MSNKTGANSAGGRVYVLSVQHWAVFSLAAGIVAAAFWDPLQNLVTIWNRQEEYGYGYLIPVITAFLIWQRKNELAMEPFRPSGYGLAVVALGGLAFFLGAVGTTHTLSQYGLVLVVMGVAWALMGWRAFSIIAMPMVLLFFMIPLPPFVYNTLSNELQLISSEIGVAVIRLFGISVYLEGNVIDLGSYKLQVVEACSGLRYLFPLASLAFVTAYLYQAEMWKRAVVFLSSVPITVLMNSFRIGVIGVLVEYGGPEQAEGFLHDFEGWVVFMACIGLLVLLMAILSRIGPNKNSLREAFGIEFPEPVPDGARLRFRTFPAPMVAALLGLLALIAASSVLVRHQANIIPDRWVFAEFPRAIGGWAGEPDRLEQIYLTSLKLDDYIIADYRSESGETINFYAAYYGDQAAGEAAHSPRACIPGGGWQIKSHNVVPLSGVQWNGDTLRVNRLLIARGDYKQVVYYWFQQRGRNITNEYIVKWYLFWDALTRNRTDGALVRLTALIGPGDSVGDAEARLQRFAQEVVPKLDPYIPL